MIFVLEDDLSIRELELYALKAAGFEVTGFADAESFLAAAGESAPSLAILDLMLPGGIDGLTAMKKLREFSPQTFVIIASAKGSEFDRVTGLDLGADDYLTKPFSMIEMVSRVKAVLRRGVNPSDDQKLSSGDIVLDKSEHSVSVAGKDVGLTRKEFKLLEIFLSSPKRVFSREMLLNRVWEAGDIETRTVDMHIASLRAKLGRTDIIETVRGVGYRFGG